MYQVLVLILCSRVSQSLWGRSLGAISAPTQWKLTEGLPCAKYLALPGGLAAWTPVSPGP